MTRRSKSVRLPKLQARTGTIHPCSPQATSMRAGVCCVWLLLSLAGCGGGATEKQAVEQESANAAESTTAIDDEDQRVACAPNGASQLARACRIERSQTDQGPVLTIRHPDGGFRRLLVVEDGRGLLAADGAQPAQVTLVNEDEIDVAIGSDRYRLPATRKASTP